MDRRMFLVAAASAAAIPLEAAATHQKSSGYLYSNPYASGVRTLVTLGDSYSALDGPTEPYTWSRQMENVGSVRSYAQGGAGVSSVAFPRNLRPLGTQVDMWMEDRSSLGPSDLTIVYFGQNDIEDDTFGLSSSFTGMRSAIDRLRNYGATADGRHVFLVLCHNMMWNPYRRAYMADRYERWSSFMLGLTMPPRFIMVDMWTAVSEIRRNPQLAGLTNVTEPGSDPRYLFSDRAHFGDRGNTFIAGVIRYYLTRGWDTAHLYPASSPQARQALAAAIASGL